MIQQASANNQASQICVCRKEPGIGPERVVRAGPWAPLRVDRKRVVRGAMVVLSPSKVSGVGVHRTYLRLPNPALPFAPPPFCYSADAFTLPSEDDEGDVGPSLDVTPNFLATQVWPSARAAATTIEKCSDPSWIICEFGCGPGLPSIVAASTRATCKRDDDGTPTDM